MVVIYFFALLFTLRWPPPTSRSRSTGRTGTPLQKKNYKSTMIATTTGRTCFMGRLRNLQTFKTWRALLLGSICVCAAVGWLVSLNRFDQLSKQFHAKRREIDALRGAVRTASTKMIDLYNEQEKNKEVPAGTEALRDLLGRRGLPVPAEAQDLVRNPLLEGGSSTSSERTRSPRRSKKWPRCRRKRRSSVKRRPGNRRRSRRPRRTRSGACASSRPSPRRLLREDARGASDDLPPMTRARGTWTGDR